MDALGGSVATDRLFFALRPDANAASHIGPVADALCAAHGLTGALMPSARWHVTLCFLGDFPALPSELTRAAEAAAAAVADTPAFDVVLDRAESFAGARDRHPLVLRGGETLAPVRAFHARLVQQLRAHGLTPDTRPYTPHLTLLYDARRVDLQPVAPVTWRADAFELVRSRIGRNRHDVMGRWTLQP